MADKDPGNAGTEPRAPRASRRTRRIAARLVQAALLVGVLGWAGAHADASPLTHPAPAAAAIGDSAHTNFGIDANGRVSRVDVTADEAATGTVSVAVLDAQDQTLTTGRADLVDGKAVVILDQPANPAEIARLSIQSQP